MHHLVPNSGPTFSTRALLAAIAMLALLALAVAGAAQVEGDRGIAPIAASNDFEVGGIEVDERGDTAEEAREAGWRAAQRDAWKRLGGPTISDDQLQGLVSAVVIERERIGPRRYVARLGVIFDRQRAARLLGEGGGAARSAPMLLLPVEVTAGTATLYERRTPWQRAWAEFQAGGSRIDYIRPSGSGGDSLLLTQGQTQRRSRLWWRSILDQFEAADVLVAIADLDYAYPGGPVTGTFTARYGPDNRLLDSFTLTARSQDALPNMLTAAVRRFDSIYAAALSEGVLTPDPTLRTGGGEAAPAVQQLIELGRQVEAAERAQREAERARSRPPETTRSADPDPAPTPAPAVVSSYVVQFVTPDAGSFDSALSAVRGASGVRGVGVTSTAIGGTSVMSVSYGGSLDELAAALRGRGFTVRQGANALSISR